jgi:hypothetical protein
MSKIYAALVASLLFTSAAYAADGMSAADIKSTLEAAASDPAKVTAYCAMTKKMDEVGDDQTKAEAAGDEIEGYFKTLGDDFQSAWDAGMNSEDGSAEAKAMDAGLTTLDGKCK